MFYLENPNDKCFKMQTIITSAYDLKTWELFTVSMKSLKSKNAKLIWSRVKKPPKIPWSHTSYLNTVKPLLFASSLCHDVNFYFEGQPIVFITLPKGKYVK